MAEQAAVRRWRAGCSGIFCGAGLLLSLLLLGGSGKVLGEAGRPLRALTAAEAVHSLTPAEAGRGLPVKLHGLVMYYDAHVDSRHGFFFLHDASGSIFVSLQPGQVLPVTQGTEVEVEGKSDAGEFAPTVTDARVRVLGRSAVPWKPVFGPLPAMMTAAYDAKWVEVEGVVQTVVGSRWNMMLKLSTPMGVIRATTTREEGVDYNRLVDARVRVRANVAPQLNQRRQVTGAHLYFQSMQDLTVERPAPAETFGGVVRPVAHLFNFEPGLAVLDSVHVQGRVTLFWPGRMLCLQDGSGGLCVQTNQEDTLLEGEQVDVVGFASVENSSTGLSEARYRGGLRAAPVVPVAVTAAAALRGEHTGELVTIEGRLISTTWGLTGGVKSPTLMLESEGRVFPVILPGDVQGLDGRAITLGSTLRVTGVSLAETDAHSGGLERETRYESFRVLLRSVNDVEVVASPSWWDAGHTVTVLLVVALVGLVVSGWVVVLRRRVWEQTLVIRQSEERFRHLAQHDALTGLANRALLHERLEAALTDSRLLGTPMAVLMMDLDKFKQVNDQFGHDAGDQMLCEAGRRLLGVVRQEDTVARMGGDEFVVLLARLGESREACRVAAKIVAAIAEPFEVEGRRLPMFASIGVCTSPGGGTSASSLLRNCDTALYGAKALGRNCWQEFGGTGVGVGEEAGVGA